MRSRRVINEAAVALSKLVDLDHLIAATGNARIVLIGEESHGTHQFYKIRAEITKRLIVEKGFNCVAVEADFPDAYKVNRCVRSGKLDSPNDALSEFQRFPLWMWRNSVVAEFVSWLAKHNEDKPNPYLQTGFYGLDLYSMHASMKAVIEYLQKVDPHAAKRAIERYSCFDHCGDPQGYGYLAEMGLMKDCEDECVRVLIDLGKKSTEYLAKNGWAAEDEFFYAKQNAIVVRDAEQYYRAMFREHHESWNVRDKHMCDTLEALLNHLSRGNVQAKVVVWAHNSHLGDARFTDMGQKREEWNLGQLARQRFGMDNVYNIGFLMNTGRVTAAHRWDDHARNMRVREALPESYEHMFHETVLGRPDRPNFYVITRSLNPHVTVHKGVVEALSKPDQLERAIGVIYRNSSANAERMSHYFTADLSHQFDTVIYLDRTSALHPLDKDSTTPWERDHIAEYGVASDLYSIPDTYPFGF